MAETIFSKIIDGEIPSEKLYEDDLCIVINDINSQTPVHVLIIPRKPIPKLSEAGPEDQALLGHLLLVAAKMADKLGVGEAYRLLINNGEGAGQTVVHLHLHILGGTSFTEGRLAG
jgi:histidine triad (HIT) family protein